MAATLTPRQQAFVREYLVDLNATQAATRAGYSARTANEQGARLLAHVSVRSAVDKAMQKRAQRVEATADEVLRDLWAIAKADPRELIELRRCCCRYCWGLDFKYQRTAGELERDREAFNALADKDRARMGGVFNEKGGAGYNAKRPPHEDCPECFGDGVESVHAHDSRKLSPGAARLYAGVKQTKEGLEIKMHAQDAALVHVGKHLGMFKDRLEHSGPDGKPLQALPPVLNVTIASKKG